MAKIAENNENVKYYNYIQTLLTESEALGKGLLPFFKKHNLFEVRHSVFQWAKMVSTANDLADKSTTFYLLEFVSLLDAWIGNIESYPLYSCEGKSATQHFISLQDGIDWYRQFEGIVRYAIPQDSCIEDNEMLCDLKNAFFIATAIEQGWNLENYNR